MRPGRRVLVYTVTAATTCAAGAQTPLTTIQVPGVFDSPVHVTHAPGDFSRIFVTEQPGTIAIVKNGQMLLTPFLDITQRVQSGGGEQGLLGIAFDPAYASTGYFYVHYTGPEPDADNVIERYTVSTTNPDAANTGSAAPVLRIDHPFENHNGGWLAFGADGYLYIATGDGGDGCDPFQSAQSASSLLGKVLRINVSTLPYTIPPGNPYGAGGGLPEIWARGLRNPWRCSFDRATGDLWIGDVGEGEFEEIDVLAPAAAPPAPPNFGWDCREGLVCASASGCTVGHCPAGCGAGSFVNPIHVYPHSPECAISGGSVYRGCAIPDLAGTYFFGDFCSGGIWSLKYNGSTVTNLAERTQELDPPGEASIDFISGFGEDAYGEVYICDLSGEVFKIVPGTFVGPDCNTNGRRDACDILSGYSTDNNANGVPDECDCWANCNGSYAGATPTLTVADFGCFQTRFVQGHPYADCNATGGLTVADFGCFQTKFVQGCP